MPNIYRGPPPLKMSRHGLGAWPPICRLQQGTKTQVSGHMVRKYQSMYPTSNPFRVTAMSRSNINLYVFFIISGLLPSPTIVSKRVFIPRGPSWCGSRMTLIKLPVFLITSQLPRSVVCLVINCVRHWYRGNGCHGKMAFSSSHVCACVKTTGILS